MTDIKWEIPYKELIRVNGLKVCLEKVPGTREWLTHIRRYGKIERVIQEQEQTRWLNTCSLKELREYNLSR